jgi:hypothetical protein
VALVRVAVLALAALLLAGCGGASKPTAATPAPKLVDRSPELLWLTRVTATADPVADHLQIRRSGLATYKLGLGGNGRGYSSGHLTAARLERLRALIASAHLPRLGEPQGKPTPGGYAYTLRFDGRTYAAYSGHLPPRLRPLIRSLDGLVSQLDEHIKFPLVSQGA